jgi:hypothetical protein
MARKFGNNPAEYNKRSVKSKLIGFALQLFAILLFMLGWLSALLFFIMLGLLGRGIYISWAFIVVLIICLTLALSFARPLYKYGKQLSMPTAHEVLISGKSPVLYLRSFKSQDTTGKIIERLPHPQLHFTSGLLTEEESLARALNQIGPCVTIGIPGEELPELGCSRLYVSKEVEWQNKVEELMNNARLVVLRAGNSNGLFWEMEKAKQILSPEKLLIVAAIDPEGGNEYRQFCIEVNKRMGLTLPPLHGQPQMGSSLLGFIYFQQNWTPQSIMLRGTNDKSVRRTIELTLDPVLKQLGVKTRTRLLRIFAVFPPWLLITAVLAIASLLYVLLLF